MFELAVIALSGYNFNIGLSTYCMHGDFSGPDRRIFLPEGLLDRSEIPEYLTGEVPGE